MDKLKKLATVETSEQIERLERAIKKQEKRVALIDRIFGSAIITLVIATAIILPIMVK